MDLRNVGILPQHRRPRLETSPPWKPQNSYQLIDFTASPKPWVCLLLRGRTDAVKAATEGRGAS